MNKLVKWLRTLALAVAGTVAPGAIAGTDWTAMNAASSEQALSVLEMETVWNGYAKAFIHPPAFDFSGGTAFTLKNASSVQVASWTAESSRDPIPSNVWRGLRPGMYTVSNGTGSRTFYRAAPFAGPYPAATRSYADAVALCDAGIYDATYIQGWLKDGAPRNINYNLYSYPSKIMGAIVGFLADHSKASPEHHDTALVIAKKIADWLLANRQPEGTPLQYFTPTYSTTGCSSPRQEATNFAGNHMMIYPAEAAVSLLKLYDALPNEDLSRDSYYDAALKIALQYAKMQNQEGTWAVVYRESDGSAVFSGMLIPERYVFGMFDDLIARLGADDPNRATLAAARTAAFNYVDTKIRPCYKWNGQFEDVEPLADYVNLQHGNAIAFAEQLFKLGRTEDACAIVDWCEDQFVVWSDPYPEGVTASAKTPTALEQYSYYVPIDGSMVSLIRGFKAAYEATGNALYLEKARALADNLTRQQRANGTIPTYFSSNASVDWINCMLASRAALDEMSAHYDADHTKNVAVSPEEGEGEGEEEKPSDDEEEVDDGLVKLYLQSTDDYGKSSLAGKAGAWKSEDGSITHERPQAGYAYVVGNDYNLREKEDASDYTFAGDVLELVKGTIILKNKDGKTLTIPKLRCSGFGCLSYATTKRLIYLAGADWKISSGATLELQIQSNEGSQLDCKANLSGSGTLHINEQASSARTTDCIKLSGDNSAFTGDVICSMSVPFVITCQSAWPGNPTTLKASGVDLSASAQTVDFMTSMTLDTANRVVNLGTFTSQFRLFAGDADSALVIGSPISGSAGLRLARMPGSSSSATFEFPVANAGLSGTLMVDEGTRVRIGNKEAIANCALDCRSGAVVEVDAARVGSKGAQVVELPASSDWTIDVTDAPGKEVVALRICQKTLQEVGGSAPVTAYLNGRSAVATLAQDGADVVLGVSSRVAQVAELRVNGYHGTETLEDFPVLVRISPDRIPGFNYEICPPQKLRFSSDRKGKTVLPHEIDTWNPAGESLVWVRLPVVSNGISFYLTWGVCEQAEAAADLWSGYRAVWHLDDYDATDGTTDSTENRVKFALAGDGTSAVPDGDFARIGKSLRVKGNLMTGAGTHGITSATDCTITGWMFCNSAKGATYGKFTDGTAFAHFSANEYAPIWLKCRNAGTQYQGNVNGAGVQYFDGKASIASGWRHFALVREGATGFFYIDGVKCAEYTGGTAPDSSLGALYMGYGGANASIVNIDEYRIALTAHSADRVAAEYAAVTDTNFIGCVGTYPYANVGLTVILR